MADGASPVGRPIVGKIRTDDEHADFLQYHLTVIRQKQSVVEAAKGPVEEAKAKLSEANEDLTKAFNAAKADLGRGYTRKYLDSLLLDGREKITAQIEFERMRARDKAILGQPVFGLQPELFPGEETPTAARDEMAWRQEGFQRGLNGELDELRDGDPPEFHQAIMAGFREGQELAQARYLRGAEAKRAAASVDANAEVKDLNSNLPEPGTPEHEAMLDASAKLARETLGEGGEPTPEAAQEAAAIERAKASLGVKEKKPARRSASIPAGVH